MATRREIQPLVMVRKYDISCTSTKLTRVSEPADGAAGYSRRSSFAGGPDYSSRGYNNGYNGGPSSFRGQGSRQDFYPPGPPAMRPNPYRHSTVPQASTYGHHDHGVYPGPSYRESYDTVNTGGSSGSPSDPWGNSTDPSSENSSLDRTHNGNGNGKMVYNDAYGSPHGMPMRDAIKEEYGYDGHDYPAGQQWQPPAQGAYRNGPAAFADRTSMAPPPPPKHQIPQQQSTRQPIPLGRVSTAGSGPAPSSGARLSKSTSNRPQIQQQQNGEKRKSWLSRRFSRN